MVQRRRIAVCWLSVPRAKKLPARYDTSTGIFACLGTLMATWGKWSRKIPISGTGKVEPRSGPRAVLPIGRFLPAGYEGWQKKISLFTIGRTYAADNRESCLQRDACCMKPATEQGALKLSIVVTALTGAAGIAAGFMIGSRAIMFDGMYIATSMACHG